MQRVLRENAFQGETHIVTGAGQGIGNRVATALALHGAQVVLVDLDPGRLEEVRDEIAQEAGVKPLVAAANVSDEEQVKAVVGRALEATGAINGLVNVAGITRDSRLVKKTYDDFKAVIAVHLYGTFLLSREVGVQHWHALFKEKGNQPLRDGVNRFIVNFSSVSARNGNVGQTDYTAAKGAIESFTKTTAREYASYGARVNAIAPGPVNTPMLADLGEDAIKMMGAATLVGRVAEPEEIAAAICAIADPRLFGYATGEVFQVNGGLYLD
jgi:3-oxoacyl-[acyl-carrier protein] reductase